MHEAKDLNIDRKRLTRLGGLGWRKGRQLFAVLDGVVEHHARCWFAVNAPAELNVSNGLLSIHASPGVPPRRMIFDPCFSMTASMAAIALFVR